LAVLQEAVPDGNQLDVFDLVAHIAFDQKPSDKAGTGEQL